MNDEEIINQVIEEWQKLKFNKKESISDFFDRNRKMMITLAINLQRKKDIEEFEKQFNPDKIYPKDIFPEISDFQLITINDLLLSHLHFPLDRLSAHISRKILEQQRKQLQELKEKR